MGIVSQFFRREKGEKIASGRRRWPDRLAAVVLSAALVSGCGAAGSTQAAHTANPTNTANSAATHTNAQDQTATSRTSAHNQAAASHAQGSNDSAVHSEATHQTPVTASSKPTQSHKTTTSSAPKGLVPAVVTRDVDGDTIHVRLHGKDETIRMLLIDTPEDVDPVKPVEPYGQSAAQYAKSRLPVGKHIYLQEGHPGYTRDKYGRLLAYVYITPHDMYNADVVRKGYARVAYIYPPNTDHLSELKADQAYAQKHHLGIWSIRGYVTSNGYNLSIACSWAAKHHESTRGCSGQAPSTSSASSSSSHASSPSHKSSGRTNGSTSSTSGLSIVSSHLSVAPREKASITIRTKPGVRATIEVDYKSGPSHASGLGAQTVPKSGLVTWSWTVGSSTTPGKWPVIIRANGKTLKTYVYVS
ncbi:thermonuclease family protein [Alicyclobacillus herbarius]|uniref:thermonuclease family protein n=1 Tax=Alicyclobacillus herbarius TaxID=122960 RepID=UPI0003F80167|nr:thermonuclease family protein [Alicyclobacillus herbarius]